MARHHVHGLEVVTHPTFEAAEQPWREIEARGAGFVFQSFDWCFTWFETIGRELDVEPVLVQVYDSRTGAEMFLPLGIERKRYGVRALGFLDGRLADHTAPLLGGPTDTAFDDVRPGAILRRVAEATGADVLDFRHLRTPVDGRRNPLVNSRAKPASYATHSLKLGGTWEAFCEERLSKNCSGRQPPQLAAAAGARYAPHRDSGVGRASPRHFGDYVCAEGAALLRYRSAQSIRHRCLPSSSIEG